MSQHAKDNLQIPMQSNSNGYGCIANTLETMQSQKNGYGYSATSPFTDDHHNKHMTKPHEPGTPVFQPIQTDSVFKTVDVWQSAARTLIVQQLLIHDQLLVQGT